ncbi:hypothetical protein [Planococcus rifietoensis]|uniref:hypothetical protein n=1 Tax=Planococcus rifietoensis TaxID=200991 RepID=UPI00384E2EF4
MKTVTLCFKPVSIQTSGYSSEALVENAKMKFLEQLASTDLLQVDSYSVSAATPLSYDTVSVGQIVESLDGTPGIIFQVNKSTVEVSFASGLVVSGSPALFKPSNCAFRKARKCRTFEEKQNNIWAAGVTGYVMTDFGPVSVIIGKKSRDKVTAHIIGEKKTEKLTADEAERLIKDEPYHFT